LLKISQNFCMNLTTFSKIPGVVNRTAGRPKKIYFSLPSALPKKVHFFETNFREELARAKDRGSPPTTIQHSTPARRKKPSAVGKGVSRFSPYCDSSTRPCAKEAMRSDHAERSGKRASLDRSSNQRPAKVRTHAKRPAACEAKRR
jgi:hypothetical protein